MNITTYNDILIAYDISDLSTMQQRSSNLYLVTCPYKKRQLFQKEAHKNKSGIHSFAY